ncbi:hypothetical protein A7J57_08105 [Agrobacterium tumefaciens]|uniref:Uncharacterized protein n=1 Tax=Agrobacterium tumefaciens TaxID=358 RepID=A0A176WXG9_AGRTU|nr:hypothetical protein A7J57_08105 [Agrobacterium tumefaciens]
MDELNRLRIFEKVDPPRLLQEKIARHQRAIHQRPGIVGKAGIQPCHQRAEINLEKTENRQQGRKAPARLFIGGIRRMVRQSAQNPHATRKDKAGDRQMRGETILRDIGAVDEA